MASEALLNAIASHNSDDMDNDTNQPSSDEDDDDTNSNSNSNSGSEVDSDEHIAISIDYNDSYEDSEIQFPNTNENKPLISKKSELSSKHESILKETKSVMKHVTLLGLFTSLIMTMRIYIFIIYSLEFTNNLAMIAIVISANWFFSGLTGYLQLIITKYWRFDNLLFLSIFLETFCMCFEAGAWNFIILSVFWVLNGASQAISPLATSYIYNLMPFYHSQQYISHYYHWFMLGYIVAPCLAGIITYYFDPRMVFIITNGLCVVSLTYSMFFVFNKETHLKERQLEMVSGYKRHSIVSNKFACVGDSIIPIGKERGGGGGGGVGGHGLGIHSTDLLSDDNDSIIYDKIGMSYSDSSGSAVSLNLAIVDNIRNTHKYNNSINNNNCNNFDGGNNDLLTLLMDNFGSDLHLNKQKWLLSNNFRFPSCLNASNGRGKSVQNYDIDAAMLTDKNGGGGGGSSSNSVVVVNVGVGGNSSLEGNYASDLAIDIKSRESDLRFFEWFMTINACIQNSLITSVEILFGSYFMVYMQFVYDKSFLISAGMASEFCLFVIIGMKFVQFSNVKYKRCGNNNNNNSQTPVSGVGGAGGVAQVSTASSSSRAKLSFYNILIIFQVISCIVIMVLCLLVYPKWLQPDSGDNSEVEETQADTIWSKFNTFWVYNGILGSMIGISMMSSQSIIEQSKYKTQNPSRSGNYGSRRLNQNNIGNEYFFNSCVKACVLLMTGLLCVYYTFQWFWYMQAVLCFFILLSTLTMSFVESGCIESGTFNVDY